MRMQEYSLFPPTHLLLCVPLSLFPYFWNQKEIKKYIIKPRWTHLDRNSCIKLPLSTKRSVAAHSLLNHISLNASPSTFLALGCLLLPFCHHSRNEGSGHWSRLKDIFLLFSSLDQLRTPLMLVQSQGRDNGEGDVGRREGEIASLTDWAGWVSYEILVLKFRCRGLILGTHLRNFSSFS